MPGAHADAKLDAFLTGAMTFLCGNLMRKGYRVTALPGCEETAALYGNNRLISDQSDRAVVLAFRRAVQGDAFDLTLVDDLAAVQRTVDYPVVLVGISRISQVLFDRLADQSIHVLQYPQTGMKELARRIENILTGRDRIG